MTNSDDDQDTEQTGSGPGDDITSDSFATPVLGTEENGTICEQLLQDLMPDLELPNVEDYLPLPEFGTQVALQRTNSHLFDFVGSANTSTMSPNAIGSSIKLTRHHTTTTSLISLCLQGKGLSTIKGYSRRTPLHLTPYPTHQRSLWNWRGRIWYNDHQQLKKTQRQPLHRNQVLHSVSHFRVKPADHQANNRTAIAYVYILQSVYLKSWRTEPKPWVLTHSMPSWRTRKRL